MLSKKQARAFFLGGTLVTFLVFIGLTIFSFSKDQDQSNYGEITEQVVRGKKIWETNIVWAAIQSLEKEPTMHQN